MRIFKGENDEENSVICAICLNEMANENKANNIEENEPKMENNNEKNEENRPKIKNELESMQNSEPSASTSSKIKQLDCKVKNVKI